MRAAADIVIVGSGIGGATLAASLAPSGRRIVILERGHHLRPSEHDRDPEAIFARGHYRPDEQWLDGAGRAFNPEGAHSTEILVPAASNSCAAVMWSVTKAVRGLKARHG